MKNSNKKAIAMALLISAVLSPSDNVAFADELTMAELNETSDIPNYEGFQEDSVSDEKNLLELELGSTGETTNEEELNLNEEELNLNEELTTSSTDGVTSSVAVTQDNQIEPNAETNNYEYKSSDFNRYDPQIGIASKGPFQSIEFYITNPDGKRYRVDYQATNNSTRYFKSGSTLTGTIVAKPNTVLSKPNSAPFNLDDFEKTVTGTGKDAYITYTLKPITVNSSFTIYSWGSHEFNVAEYWLNGGTWTDPRLNEMATDGVNYLQLRIPMYSTVYKPTDPTRKGYNFLGWTGSTDLNNNTRNFTKDNYYQFDEVDRKDNIVGLRQGVVAKLYAQWEAKKPEFETINQTIKKGETVDPITLIKEGTLDYNDDQVNEPGRKVEIIGEFDNNTPGTYEVTIKVTNGVDGVTEETATITVTGDSEEYTPEGEEKTVFVNDEVPEAKSFVKDFENLPEGTTVSFVETPSTEEAGEYEVKLTVTYPDGTTDEVVGKLIVKAKPNTSDPSDPGNPKGPETPGEDPEVPGKDQSETPKDSDKEDPILPGTPDEDTPDLPKEDEPGTSDNKDEDERVVVPSPDEDKPELPSTENTVTPDKSEESEDQDTSKKPEDTVKPGTPDKTENSDDIEESGEQETTDGKDDGDKVIVPTPDNKKPEGSEESGTTDKSETPDKSEESESQDTTDKKDDDGKIRVPSINKDNEPDDRNSSSKIKQSSESSIISADDNNTGTNVTRSPRSGHDNVQTGVSGAIGVASILATASLGLAATKNKEDEEE